MTPKAPTRRSNAELAEDALQKARRYRARAREEARRAAGEFGLWVRTLAERGDAAAVDLCARWEGRKPTPKPDAKRPARNPAEPIKAAQNWPVRSSPR